MAILTTDAVLAVGSLVTIVVEESGTVIGTSVKSLTNALFHNDSVAEDHGGTSFLVWRGNTMYDFSGEGRTWIHGWHLPTSEEGQALLAANALARPDERPTGPMGPQGATGLMGPAGPRGATGLMGPQGAIRLTGI